MFNDQSFNDMLTNDIVSFEQLGPVVLPQRGASEMSTQYMFMKWIMHLI